MHLEKWKIASRKLLTRRILLSHGGGGKETHEIIEKLVKRLVPPEYWKTPEGTGLDLLDDASHIKLTNNHIAVTIDSYTVDPIEFPGGDIGKLAASGTINDLLMSGAKPIAALDSIIVEEGFEVEKLAKIIDNMVETFINNNVSIIGGDFKVVPNDSLDGIIITTTGIGVVIHPIRDDRIMEGDKIIVTGPVGNHGAAILSARGTYGLKVDIKSDVAPLTSLMIPLIEEYGPYIGGAGDPTRGGVAMLLNEWAKKNDVLIYIDESKIPIRDEVKAYADLIGVDPLALASEGVAVIAVRPDHAEKVLERIHELGLREASIIGEVRAPKHERHKGIVIAKTTAGGFRIVEEPSGEIVPRIC
ncbi:MAG: hydrogenase expression/formation protein HypE [Desulfurococcales archaeon]|nr:hydrogenase expression/formation protein HypE [Desulfurococcales archaeon]